MAEKTTQFIEIEQAEKDDRFPVCVHCGKPLEIECKISLRGLGKVSKSGVLVVSEIFEKSMLAMHCANEECRMPLTIDDLWWWNFGPGYPVGEAADTDKADPV